MAFDFYIPGADPNSNDDENFDWSSIGTQLPQTQTNANFPQSSPVDFSIAGANPTVVDYSGLASKLNNNRFSNLLGTVAPINGATATSQVSPPPANVNYAGMFNQPSPIFDEYKNALMNKPDQSDYEPSTLRRIGAALAGFGTGVTTNNPAEAMKVAQDFNDEPYSNAKDEWTTNVGRLKLAADEERLSNAGKVTAIKDFQQSQLNLSKEQRELLNTVSEIQQRASQTGLNNVRMQQIQNDLNNPKVANLIKTDDGFLTAVDDRGNVVQNYGKVNLSVEETKKLEAGLQLRNSLANTAAQGQNQINLENVRAGNAQTLEGTRQANRVALKQTPGATPQKIGSQAEFAKRQGQAVTNILRDPRASAQGWTTLFKQDPKSGQYVPDDDAIRSNPAKWQAMQNAVKQYMQLMAPSYERGY